MRLILKLFLSLLLLDWQQSEAQELLTLEEAIEIALKNNYDIRIAGNDAEIAARNNTIGNAGMLPNVNAVVTDNYTLLNLNQEFASGLEVNRDKVGSNNFAASVNLNWTLFDGLRMFATKGRLKRLEEIGELAFKEELQSVVARVIVAYYNMAGANQQIRALDEAIKVSDERVKLADMKFQVGTVSKVDYLQARVDLNEQKSNLLNKRIEIQLRKAELNAILARPAETDFLVPDTIPVNLNPTLGLADLEKKNFALQIAARNVEVAKYTKREFSAGYFPELTANLGYGFARSQSDAGFTLYNQNYGLNAGFSLIIPLFNGLNTIRQVKVAALQLESSKFNLERARIQTQLAFYSALRNFQTAKELLLLEEESIQLADENQKIALERFRLAQSTSIELREAQISYVNAQTRRVNARLYAKTAETELLRLQGELVK